MTDFFKEFLKSPLKTGAVIPSSKKLSKLVVDSAYLSNKKCVIELGSGTGVFTKEIIKNISPECVFFSLELNQFFVDQTKKNCPDATVYHASAQDIQKYLIKHQQSHSNCIISGIPWAVLNYSEQKELMDIIYDSLCPDSIFITFAYLQGLVLPSGIKFRRLLHKKFKQVKTTKTVWENLPPAFVYCCEK